MYKDPPSKIKSGMYYWLCELSFYYCYIVGGGFAMAAASNESGLSTFLGKELVYLEVLPPFLILIIVATATTFLTEVSSNTAIANIILPVLAQMVK